MIKVLLLGSHGLIGHQVYFRLNQSSDISLFNYSYRQKVSSDTVLLDARDESLLEKSIRDIDPDIIVNCMGILIAESNEYPERAVYLNAYIPNRLKYIADDLGAKLIHISTDCVFSGKNGPYVEGDVKDANDIYGRAKALGEVVGAPHLTLRTSVVGPELKSGEELFHWFMQQEGSINGYAKSLWSGVTTLEIAKAVHWAIKNNTTGLYHITNGESISKYDLLMLFKKYTFKDIRIEKVGGRITNKCLIDTRKEINYVIPSYDEMIKSMVGFINRNKNIYKQYVK
ncbi:MAG: SDR family oxidoreductase [Sedimenticola sp.]